MSELYKAIAGSPITYLVADISANQTTISIADDSALPDAPNICTIGYGENIETIRYGAKSNGVLQNVTRGLEGTPRAWKAGTEVARFFTAYDHNSIIENFNSHLADYANHNHDGGSTPKISWENITEKPFSPRRIAYLEVPAGQTQTISSNLSHANNYILSATQGRAGGCLWLIVTGDQASAIKIAGAGRQGTATITNVTLKYTAHAAGGETLALYVL